MDYKDDLQTTNHLRERSEGEKVNEEELKRHFSPYFCTPEYYTVRIYLDVT